MDKKIRIGLVGGGGLFGWYAPILLKLNDICEVVSVAEKRESEHLKIKDGLRNPDIAIYKDYNELYEHGGADAVFINLPHHMHMNAAVGAAQSGYHVLCEKVMARNTYECRQMIDASKKAGKILGIAHDRRFSRNWIALKKSKTPASWVKSSSRDLSITVMFA